MKLFGNDDCVDTGLFMPSGGRKLAKRVADRLLADTSAPCARAPVRAIA